jgi:hypothetical protein
MAFETYIGLEATAASVRSYDAQLVHGLLQTEGYARAALLALCVGESSEGIEELVRLQLARQAQLDRVGQPLRLWTIMEEEALRRPVGGPAVMGAQLGRLLDATESPDVTIQVLPTSCGAHAGLDGAFSIIGFRDPARPPVAYLPSRAESVCVENEVAELALRFDHLQAAALDIGESADLIAKIAHEMQATLPGEPVF